MTDSLHIRIDEHPADGRPVVFLHGFASSGAADWPAEAWAPALSAAGRTSIVIDLPGHGESAGLGVTSTGEIVDRIAETIGEKEVDVVAYSLGARLAWDLASHDGVTVRRLVLGGLSPVEPFAAVDLPAARDAVSAGAAPQDPLTGMIVSMTRMPGNRASDLLDVVESLAAEPFDPALRPPAQPVLLLGGTDDPMAQGIDALAEALPDARVRRVPGDHLSALHSDQLRDETLAFLDE
ncbi:alpha/beta fold hydrolase [Microbacterium sp. NPDC089987]|uniref:alpha/beta fold hydrolase n=1 Tax=Microbacterium sp. NPDC089987 TaxID=3364202 RepID=UPI003821EA6D